MKRAIFLAFASIGFAQTQPDAMALLRGVASLAQSNNRWLIEGVTAASGQPEKATFSLRRESAKEVRFESHGGADPAEIVCDGTNKWIYSIPLHRYSRTPLTDSSVCVPVLDEWAHLPERLGSPVAAGTSNYSAGGQQRECQLVRGSLPPAMAITGPLVKTLCIDPAHNFVVWEKTESKWGSQTTLYTRVDSNPPSASAAISFEPPAGSVQTDFRLPVPSDLGSPNPMQEDGVQPPRLVTRKEPNYDEESRRAHVQGTVVLYVIVDVTGRASEVVVFRSLNPGLDANAVKAVRQWRFVPAQENGHPRETAAVIEVNFKLAP